MTVKFLKYKISNNYFTIIPDPGYTLPILSLIEKDKNYMDSLNDQAQHVTGLLLLHKGSFNEHDCD